MAVIADRREVPFCWPPNVVTVDSSSPAALEEAVNLFPDRRWDPIGLYGHEGDEVPEPGTEYRRYAAQVVGMFQRGETAPSISHYLMQQATQSMGVGPGPTRTVADALHTWWNDNGGRLPIEA